MAEKKIKTRIQQKHDVEANWLKATSFIPLAGEVIVYDADATYTYERFKIGDGTTTVTNLPFAQMTDDERTKLAGIADGANKTIIDTALSSSSTNPVQNKVVNTALSGKAPTSHASSATTYGVSTASNYGHAKASGTTPKANGTAAVGSETSSFARGDHVHPTDTTRAAAADLTGHTGDTTAHITSTERTNWNAAKTHADAAHAPSNAEKNQNAFSNVKVGSTTIAADSATDTLELVAGSNVTITPDATNDKVTIAASHPTITKSTDSTSTATPEHGLTFTTVDAITRDSNGHVTKINTKTVTLPDAGLHYVDSSNMTVVAGSSTSSAYLATKWSIANVDGITTPTDGMSISLRTPAAGYSGGILLSIDGGTTYHPIVRNVNSLVTTHYAEGSTLILTFNPTQTADPYTTAGTTTTVTGCWQIADYDSNTTYTNVKLGHGYATCSTAAGTKAKTASLSSYTLTTGGIVAVKFTEGITVASPTLNINSKGAKSIYYKGAALTDTTLIKAGDTVTFIYSSNYHILSIDRLASDVNTLNAHASSAHAPSDAEKNVQSDWSETNTSSDAYIKNKPSLATVATSGSYNDLSNKPTIPTKSSWNYDDTYVKHSASQSLTDAQKSTARANIGAGTSSFSGSYNDLTNKPTIPTVNNATLTIQKNGTNVATFTANSSTAATANITVPTGAAADKGVDTSISAASTSTNLPTSKAVAAFVEGKGYKTTDNNTTYTIAAGDSNGQIKVTPSSGSAYNVSVKGLGSAAYAAKGAANGVAELDSTGKVPSSQLPSYVDDVVEGTYVSTTSFKDTSGTAITGETGKIYVDTATNKTYRWSGSAFTEISASLALGETSSTAYRGDRGKTAYEHSQATHARTDATAVAASSTNGKIKINGTDTTVYTHPTSHAASMITGLATVATSGSYNDLTNKPTIPAAVTVDTALSSTSTNPVQNKVVTTALAGKADKSEGTFFIEGSGTTDATAKTSTWVGTSDKITEYYDGLAIRYKIGVAGQSTTTLNINNLGAKTVYLFNTTKLTTHFPVNSIINLIYHEDLNSGCWVCNDYDANTNTYQRVYPTTTSAEYPITTRYNTTTGSSYYAEYGRYSTGVTLNPSTNTITATKFKGALTGNADTATKATQDASGNVITSTYSKIGHTHGGSTANVAPHTHTHSVTVNGTTGGNSGTAVNAVTGYGSFSGGSGSLTSDTTSTNGIKYVEAVSHNAASLTGTKTFNTDAIKDVTLSASTTSTDGPTYVESVTHTAASLTGTKTFNTDAIKAVALSASTASTDGPAYISSVSGGSGSLKSYDASSGGNVKTSSGRVPYLHDVSHTAASLTGDTTFVKTQGTFSAGTTPVSSASPVHTSTATGSAGSTTVASYSAGVLTLSNVSNHTHTYDKTTSITLTRGTAPSLGAATTGTVGISGGSISKTTYYLAHAHSAASGTTSYMKVTPTAASTATVGISGGSITPVTKYMKKTTTAASTGTVGISSAAASVTTKYLHHAHTGASLGTPSTASVAPNSHTHSYGSSTALTTGNNSGTAVAAITAVSASTN